MWNHFTKKDGKITCNYCKEPNITTYKFTNTASSNLKRHYLLMHKKEEEDEDQPKIFKFAKPVQNENEFNKDFCIFLIDNCFSWRLTDKEEFVSFFQKYLPHLKIPCRQTVSNYVTNLYEKGKLNVKEYLKNFDRKSSLTIDGWTGPDTIPYYGITCKFTCVSLNYQIIL